MADAIRNTARRAIELHEADEHVEALACAITLAASYPDSALAFNLAGYLHADNARVAWDAREEANDDEPASGLESYHFAAALDAFSAAALIAPNCVLTAVCQAEALAANDRHADARQVLLRALATANHADPAVNHVGDFVVGGSTPKARKSNAERKAREVLEEITNMINDVIVTREARELLGGDAAIHQAREAAKLFSETYPYSARAQLLPVHIELEQARAPGLADDTRRIGLRRGLFLISVAAGNFDSSLLIALFHAKVLFALDKFDDSERECRRALRIDEPTDPKSDDIPPAVSVPGADYDARVSCVKKQLRILLKRIIVVAAVCWSSMESTQHHRERVDRVISVSVDALQEHYDGNDQSAAKTISDAQRFLKQQKSCRFLICPNSGCGGKKFVDTESLCVHMRSKHRDVLWEKKLDSILGPDFNKYASEDADHSLDGIITLRQDSDQHDIFHLPRVQPMFESLLLSPSVGIQAEPLAEMRQRKCIEGALIFEDIKKKLRMLPKDTRSTKFQGSSLEIQNLWLKFLETSALDYREVILPLARSFQWVQMKESIALSVKDLRGIGIIGDANIDIIFGTSGQSVKEMASTSSCQQSLDAFHKNNSDKDLSILSLIIWSLCNLRHFRDKFLTEPLVWLPSADNICIAQQFYEIFTSWEKNDHHLTDEVLSYMKILLQRADSTIFSEKLQVGTNFASEVVALILFGLHMSETCSRFSLNPITSGGCICPTHNLFGIKFRAQVSCKCGKYSVEYPYTALFHKLDACSAQTTKIKSFAELPVLLDEQFCKDNNCEDCGPLLNIELFLSNTPHFFTIVLNWLGSSESQDTLSEILAGITSPVDTGFFCKSADSSTMYTVTSMICCYDESYVCFARNDEDKWLIYDFETVETEDTWEHLLERFKDCKLQPEVLFFEVIK